MAPTCKLCRKPYELQNCTPVSLSCGHCFCRQCLVTEKVKLTKLRCSTCLKAHKGSPVSDLPINHDFLETEDSPSKTQDAVKTIGQQDSMLIMVLTPLETKIHLKVQRNAKIADIKLLLQVKYGIDANTGHLSLESGPLEDDKTLINYGIAPETVIYTDGCEEKEEILESLGSGGYGDAFLIKKNERELVVKKVELAGLDDKVRNLAIQEMKLLEDLNHPNILSYEGGYEKEKCLHILVEYCSGGDLARQIKLKLKEGGLFEERKILLWIQKIAEALLYIHDRRIIHRDIKPPNVFLSSSGTVKLGDFGIARVLSDKSTRGSTMIGTTKYLAIEVVNNGMFTYKADIFALGCTMYELAALKSNYPYVQVKLNNAYSDSFKSLVISLLDHNPDSRPDASEILSLPVFKKISEKEVATALKDLSVDDCRHDQKQEKGGVGKGEGEQNLENPEHKPVLKPKPVPRRTVSTDHSTPLKERSQCPSADSCISVLDMFCNESKSGNDPDQKKALDDILFAMKSFPQNADVQLKGCSSLAHITKGNDKKILTPASREEVASVLLSTLENYLDNRLLMMLSCLRFREIGKHHYLVIRVEQLVPKLLQFISQADGKHDASVRLNALDIIQLLSSRVSEDVKKLFASLGTFEVLLNIISDKRDEEYYEDVLPVCWNILVNLTDESPGNCQIFVDQKGLPLIMDCLSMSTGINEWKTSLWLTLTNVSEVIQLRSHLLQPDVLNILLDHLNPEPYDTEVSWEAAQIFVNILSEGETAWTVDSPQRNTVVQKIAEAIEKWDLDSAPKCVFNTLRPMWLLLEANHTSVCQYWAIWTLGKLTRVQRDKYCPMVEEEEGDQRLNKLKESLRKAPRLMRGQLKKNFSAAKLSAEALKLTMQVINTCKDYKMYMDYGTKNREQLTILFKAAVDGDLEVVEMLMDTGINPNSKSFLTGHNERSAVHLATENAHTDVVNLLIDAGASVHIRDFKGMIALHTAAWNGYLDLVKLLLIFGSDPTLVCQEKGWQAIHFAAAGGHLHVLQYLKEKCDLRILTPNKKSALHLAAERGRKEVVAWLMAEGIDVDLRDEDSFTALDYATRDSHSSVVQILNNSQETWL